MLPVYFVLAALLLAAPSAVFAQEETQGSEPRQAVPRGSRPQGDNPRTGTAAPRSEPDRTPDRPEARRADPDRPQARRADPDRNRGRTVIVPDRRRTVIVRPPNIYGYYPRQYYPYGYGAFGLGYFYYDPYRWNRGGAYPGYGGYGYDGYYQQPFSTFDIGELRLDVSPRHAQVYVDGYYAGVVDDYDGTFQALKLESGSYRIEIVAPGYETLSFDVRINPGQKIRYRGDLRR